uniref:Putative non-structural protein NS1 n=1 Tax=Atrato Denso-like virus TaxID=2689332 RepID=A0A6B9KG95_9VIRU|nr:putative non-structural protein NS1 [Atrato Denso-like virus]
MESLFEEQDSRGSVEENYEGESTAESGNLESLAGSDDGDRVQPESAHLKRGLNYYIKREDTRERYYVSGIWKVADVETVSRLYQRLDQCNSSIRFLYAFLDDNHVHVIHDCTYTSSACRCFKPKLIRKRSVRRQLFELERADVDAIINYFFSRGKIYVYGKMRIYQGAGFSNRVVYNRPNEDTWQRALQSKNVSIPFPSDEAIPRYYQTGAGFDSEALFGDDATDEASVSENQGATRTSDQRSIYSARTRRYHPYGLRGNRTTATAEEIEKELLMILCTPLQETLISEDFQNNRVLKYLDETEQSVKSALRCVDLKFKNMSIGKLIEFYKTKENFKYGHPLWFSHSISKFSETYMSITKSYNVLILWIAFEFCGLDVDEMMEYNKDDLNLDTWIQISTFVKKVFLWLQGKFGRKYTLYFIGPTQCGKTMFADMIMDFRLSVGVLKNFNKNTTFPLNSCNNKDMYYLNEPNISPDHLEEWKKLSGGDRHNIDVKYKQGTTQAGSKVLLTGNNYALPRDPIFNSRIEYFHCKYAPFLRLTNSKRYHPLALIKLLEVAEDVLEEKIVTDDIIIVDNEVEYITV